MTLRRTEPFGKEIVTGDKACVFRYDLETKRQSLQRKRHESRRRKRMACQNNSYSKGKAYYKFVPPEQAVNQALCLEFLEQYTLKMTKFLASETGF
jgi:hypothetical protein